MSLIHTTHGRNSARAYCGMWIVDCLRCRNAEQLNRFQPGVTCTYCGIHIEIVWPAEDTVYSIERLLTMRPLEYTRNWNPDETLSDLMQENALHGVFDPLKVGAADHPGLCLLSVDDKAIKRDMLPGLRTRELKQIGDT